MFKISCMQWLVIITLLFGSLSQSYAATPRDKAARQFEQKMNGLHIQKRSNSDQFYGYNDISYQKNLNYDAGNDQMNNNYSNENDLENQIIDQQNFSDEAYNDNVSQDADLIKRIENLEDDMGDMMRRIGKLERELKAEKSKHKPEKKTHKGKPAKKAKKK